MSRRALFRREALDFQLQHKQWGHVALLQPPSAKVLTWLSVVAVVLVLAFVCFAQYARKETVAGYLVPSAGTAKIFVPQRGFVKQLHVREGEEVEEGQPLLTISTEQISSSGEDVNNTILDTLTLQREFIKRQIGAEDRRGTTERERLNALMEGIAAEISQLEAQTALQMDRLKLTEGFVTSAVQLTAKGAMTDLELKRREQSVLEQRQTLSALRQQTAARRNQLTETRYTLEQLPIVLEDKLQSLRNDLSAVEQRIAEVNGRRAYVIRAPAAGRVATLQATEGQAADPRHLQLEIVPRHASLQAELFFPTRAFGFVHAGQEVRILYDAFPYQKFGTYRGRIVKVSQTILTGNDPVGPISLKEPAYRVIAALERPDIDAYGQKIPLQPQMLLRADVILERRSLLSWLLDPLLSARM
ncbi:MAG: HlyD family efflux transporter periplasmic adaptor subunit [Alphaproteobacteria bacterium]|nr:MAG: HlyD family efflux transporter periplasmic adaptor subunit [Alphaproteobacteria bacterium]